MASKKIVLKIGDPKTGDPVKGSGEVKQSTYVSPGRTTIDTDLDLRDRLTELVGKGNELNPDEKAGIYGDLRMLVGEDKAKKLMTHAYIFNTRSDVNGLKPEDKLNAFYSIGSNDPYVKDVISRTKSLGYGVGPGFRTSQSRINQVLAGRVPPELQTIPTDTQNKIMLSVKK